jgi:hypothetical protein
VARAVQLLAQVPDDVLIKQRPEGFHALNPPPRLSKPPGVGVGDVGGERRLLPSRRYWYGRWGGARVASPGKQGRLGHAPLAARDWLSRAEALEAAGLEE